MDARPAGKAIGPREVPAASRDGPRQGVHAKAPFNRQTSMNDEEAIRQLVTTWMDATKSGDVETVLSMMTDDVVFLVAGQPVMRKADFAAKARAQAGKGGVRFDGTSDIQEIKILGDWAFMWTKLTVVAAPADGPTGMKRAGYTLTILQKQDGRWALARDANMLAPV